MRIYLAIPLALLAAGPATAANLALSGASASSNDPGTDDVNYEPKNLRDNKRSTVWVEGENGSGLGSWAQVDLASAQKITGFRIWNGNWATTDYWQRHNRVKDIEVELSDGTKHSFTLKDEMAPEEIRFPSAVTTSSLKIKIKSIYGGSTFNDTCISEIQLFDDSAPDYAQVSAYKASSVYPTDADDSYEAHLVGDGLLDTMWCEGDEASNGSGQWLELTFAGTKQISQLTLNNGNALSVRENMKANRAKTATLRFSDGSTETITLKTSLTTQTLTFAPRSATSVRITFGDVVAGSEFNDLCISEAYFK